jgi:hypothetical protein
MTYECISPLRRRMIEDMTVRNFAAKTQDNYISAVAKLAKFLGRSPDTATTEELRLFQLHLTANRVGAPTINRTVTALRFFFTVTLDRSDVIKHLTLVPEPRKIPVMLSPEVVARLPTRWQRARCGRQSHQASDGSQKHLLIGRIEGAKTPIETHAPLIRYFINDIDQWRTFAVHFCCGANRSKYSRDWPTSARSTTFSDAGFSAVARKDLARAQREKCCCTGWQSIAVRSM